MTDTNTPIVYPASKTRSLGVIVIGLIFIVIGVLMISEQPWIAWPSIAFMSVLTIIVSINILPNASYLKLDEKGFETKSLYKTSFTEWKDVDRFFSGNVSGNKMVLFNFKPEYQPQTKLRSFNTGLLGVEAAMPIKIKFTVEETAQLMNEWKNAHS